MSDITAGKVFVEITDSAGNHLLERTQLKIKEFTEFRIAEKDVYVQIMEMENHLVGDDICSVHLSFEKPEATLVSPGNSDESGESNQRIQN